MRGRSQLCRLDGIAPLLPRYAGNGMYLTAGNLSANPKVGLLFIDMERPHRLRLHGTAAIRRAPEDRAALTGAAFLLRIAIGEIFPSCPRDIHPHRRPGTSGFVPGGTGPARSRPGRPE